MDEKKYSRIIRNPRHIAGVFNYCDRWCERCPLTLRCSVFAVGEAEGDKLPPKRNSEKLWERLAQTEPAAAELLQKNLDHPGVSPAKSPRFKTIRHHLDHSTIGAAAKRYMEFAHDFVQKHEPLAAMIETSPNSPVSIADAYDIIAWYHMPILVKLSRALHRDEDEADDPDLADMPSDSDGSAKIALIMIDRSIVAWSVLCRNCSDLREPALSAMVTLSRLRTAVEKCFPKARAFVRPGFDTLRFK